MVNELID